MQWETVIGLEVHMQLATKSKLFSRASAKYGADVNTQACHIDLGLPGVLPVLNSQAVEMAIKFGVAIGAVVNKHSMFDRKNYFYADLPKGYQISQNDHPVVGPGYIDITLDDDKIKRINIIRAHLEEDAGKSLHEDFHGLSGIDFNRSGVPLLEIVSDCDMRSSQEAIAYLKIIHTLGRYLEISDCNMQEGSMRCDVNVSVRPMGSKVLGTRTEIKNVNSFRFVEKAIHYEVQRQIAILEDGGKIAQETRLYDSDKNLTQPMRSKENAHDYRYFPDPDLLPIAITEAQIQKIKDSLPELPQEKTARFMDEYNLSAYETGVLVSDKNLANFFEATNKLTNNPKLTANLITQDLAALLNKHNMSINACPISFENIADLVNNISTDVISGKIAKEVFIEMWEGGKTASFIIKDKGLQQITDSGAIEDIASKIIKANPNQVNAYLGGRDKLFGFFVGQVMKETAGKANPKKVNEILKAQFATMLSTSNAKN